MISVCMTTFNGEKYIKAQLFSILKQMGENDEIIISDDSSSDHTIEIIEEIDDKRIILLKGNRFNSPIFNLENALKHSIGDYIFLADQDDIWLPNKVKETIKHINKNNVVMSDAMLVDEQLNIKSSTLDSWRIYKSGFFRNLWKNRYLGCCMAFHREKLNHILPFPKKIKAHDVWIGLLAELSGGLIYLPIPLIKYRRHENNFSTVGNKSKNSNLLKFTYRFHFIIITLSRTLKCYFLYHNVSDSGVRIKYN